MRSTRRARRDEGAFFMSELIAGPPLMACAQAPVANHSIPNRSLQHPVAAGGGRMVYGLNVKPAYGYYVDVEPVDGDVKSVKLVDESPDGGYPARGIPLAAGRPVQTEYLPTRMRWLDRRGNPIPDFDNGLMLNVSTRAKKLIESMEPGVHQFVPVTYEDSDGNYLEDRYFLFVSNRLDTMDPDNPTMALHLGTMWVPVGDLVRRGQEVPPGKDPSQPARLIISADRVGSAHLWVEKHLSGGSTFISDELENEIRVAGLTGINPGKVETR
jgi:hypothetical protein